MGNIQVSIQTANRKDRPRAHSRITLKYRVAYYLTALCPIFFYLFLGNFQYRGEIEENQWATNYSYAQFVLLLFPLVTSSLAMMGMLFFGPPEDRLPEDDWEWDDESLLLLTYVSRGHQPDTLHRATGLSIEVLEHLNVRYQLEVVTDEEVPSEYQHKDGLYHVVPTDYQTPNGAKYKARALQYLLDQRTLRLNGAEDQENIWIMHMDEESVLTPECVLGIQEFVEKYDVRKTPGAIGQGEIKYNAYEYGERLLSAAIDAGRTGGDLGLFRTQYRIAHGPLVGMHGSYVLTPASIERDITWDVGGHGSITEDSYFALMAMQLGVRYDWVEGYIREQSPFTFMDIVRQRRRWFCGLSHVANDPKLNFFTTLTLRMYVWFWAFSAIALPMPLIYLVFTFSFGSDILPYWLFMTAAFCAGLYGATYSVGVLRNLKDCEIPIRRKLAIICASAVSWFLFIPAYAECFGTLYGIIFPVKTFYVVKKDGAKRRDAISANSAVEAQARDETVFNT